MVEFLAWPLALIDPDQWLAQFGSLRSALEMKLHCFRGKVSFDASQVVPAVHMTEDQPLAHAQMQSLSSCTKPSTVETSFHRELRCCCRTKVSNGNINLFPLSFQSPVADGPLSQGWYLCPPSACIQHQHNISQEYFSVWGFRNRRNHGQREGEFLCKDQPR